MSIESSFQLSVVSHQFCEPLDEVIHHNAPFEDPHHAHNC
jgi:hypothetical protein